MFVHNQIYPTFRPPSGNVAQGLSFLFPMAKTPAKLFSTKFRNWLLYLVVSRQNLKSIAGYTL